MNPSPTSVRRRLRNLPSDGMFRGFIQDNYKEVYQTLSAGMSREECINALFERIDPLEVNRSLNEFLEANAQAPLSSAEAELFLKLVIQGEFRPQSKSELRRLQRLVDEFSKELARFSGSRNLLLQYCAPGSLILVYRLPRSAARLVVDAFQHGRLSILNKLEIADIEFLADWKPYLSGSYSVSANGLARCIAAFNPDLKSSFTILIDMLESALRVPRWAIVVLLLTISSSLAFGTVAIAVYYATVRKEPEDRSPPDPAEPTQGNGAPHPHKASSHGQPFDAGASDLADPTDLSEQADLSKTNDLHSPMDLRSLQPVHHPGTKKKKGQRHDSSTPDDLPGFINNLPKPTVDQTKLNTPIASTPPRSGLPPVPPMVAANVSKTSDSPSAAAASLGNPANRGMVPILLKGSSSPVWIDSSPVTLVEYRACAASGSAGALRCLLRVGMTHHPESSGRSSSSLNVSFDAAKTYCRSRGMRLPSAAELLAASQARAIAVSPYHEWTNAGVSFDGAQTTKGAMFLYARCVRDAASK